MLRRMKFRYLVALDETAETVQLKMMLLDSYSFGLEGDDHECTCAQSTSLHRPCGRYPDAWSQQASQKLPGHLVGHKR